MTALNEPQITADKNVVDGRGVRRSEIIECKTWIPATFSTGDVGKNSFPPRTGFVADTTDSFASTPMFKTD